MFDPSSTTVELFMGSDPRQMYSSFSMLAVTNPSVTQCINICGSSGILISVLLVVQANYMQRTCYIRLKQKAVKKKDCNLLGFISEIIPEAVLSSHVTYNNYVHRHFSFSWPWLLFYLLSVSTSCAVAQEGLSSFLVVKRIKCFSKTFQFQTSHEFYD